MFEIELDGIDELERAIRALPAGLPARVYGNACRAMARVVAETARQEVPVRTGALQQTIRVRSVADRYRGRRISGAAASVFSGGPGAFHATLVHFGTVNQAANPFLTRAIQKQQAAQHQEFARAASQSFERLTRQLATGNIPIAVRRLL